MCGLTLELNTQNIVKKAIDIGIINGSSPKFYDVFRRKPCFKIFKTFCIYSQAFKLLAVFDENRTPVYLAKPIFKTLFKTDFIHQGVLTVWNSRKMEESTYFKIKNRSMYWAGI